MKRLSKNFAFVWVALSAALLVGGVSISCAPRNNPALERARSSYVQTQQNPEVVTYAQTHLQEARAVLDAAEREWEEDGDAQEVSHLAYLAEQKANIAVATAQQKVAETEEQQLIAERDRLLLSARSLEAEKAAARASQLERELAELKARETERGLIVTLPDNVLFEYDQATLKPGAMRNLYPLVTFLREHPNRTLLIEGHTDSTGSDSYNLDLSRRRAQAVSAFLMQNGISPERIMTRGYGESYPVASNDSEAGRQQNRRVEVVIAHEGQRVVER